MPPLPLGPWACTSWLSLRAIASNRLGSALSRTYVAVACDWADAHDGIVGGNGRRVLRVALRGVQDVADLDRVLTEVGGWLAEVDLRHAPLRCRPGHVADDLGLELLVDDVALEDRAVLGERDALVLELRLVGGIDRRRGDLGRATDAVDPVAPLDDVGRRVDRRGEDGLEPILVRSRVVRLQPARGRRPAARSTRRSRRSGRRPPRSCRAVMSLSAASALAFAALFWAADGPTAPRSVSGATSITHGGVIRGSSPRMRAGRRGPRASRPRLPGPPASPGAWCR